MKLRKKQELVHLPASAEIAMDLQDDVQPYDYRRAISEHDWQSLLQYLHDKQKTKWEHYKIMLGYLLLMYPERREEIVDDQYIELYKSKIARYDPETETEQYARAVDDFIKTYPDHRDEIEIPVNLFDVMQKQMEEEEDIGKYITLGLLAIRLFPERRGEMTPSTERIAEIKQFAEDAVKKAYREPLILPALAIMFYPEIKSQLPIDQQALAAYQARVESNHTKNWYAYMHDAFYLSLLTADEVRFSEQGYELISKEQLSKQPGLPQRKIA